jgi:hypothetical protein
MGAERLCLCAIVPVSASERLQLFVMFVTFQNDEPQALQVVPISLR